MNHKTFKVGIFPFDDVVLFPTGVLPLYVYDEIYLRLIKEAIKNQFPIAIGFGEKSSEKNNGLFHIRSICGAGWPQVIEEFEDGSQYVIIKGIARIQIQKIASQSPFIIAEASIISDTPEKIIGHHSHTIERLKKILFDFFDNDIKSPEQRIYFKQQIHGITNVIDFLSMFVIQTNEVKQTLLETFSIADRLSLLNALLIENGEENPLVRKAILSFEKQAS